MFNNRVILLLIILIIFSRKKVRGIIEDFTNSFNYDCPYGLSKVLDHVTKKRGMKEKKKGWDFYFPCGYNSCEIESRRLKPENSDQKFFLMDGCDSVNSKVALWNSILHKFGREEASTLMPNTFILNNKNDMKQFIKHYYERKEEYPKCKYILKNHKQRQEGLKLVNKLEDIKKANNQGFHLVQNYMENPFLISKRKINIRYYLLIVCTQDKITGYIHNNGFMYYTPKFYNPGTLDFKEHITTGYIDRKVYEENPLTITDFNIYLDKIKPNLSNTFFLSVQQLFTKIMIALHDKLCKLKHLQKNTLFQLYGTDIAPDINLIPSLMEINKGPDLSPKDDRDRDVKFKVQGDIIDIVDTEGDHELKEPNGVMMVYSAPK
jgi:hypothetical protein